MQNITEEKEIFNPEKWGLPLEAMEKIGLRFYEIWERYKDLFKTKTRDTNEYGLTYLRGLLTMEKERNYKNIARNVQGVYEDGQKLQHFMSDSPWCGKQVFKRIQQEVRNEPNFSNGMLTLDDSGDERSGNKSAGVARQYIGRLGKVEMGKTGVVVGYISITALILREICE